MFFEALIIATSLTIGNYIYAYFAPGYRFEAAGERSFFQFLALMVFVATHAK